MNGAVGPVKASAIYVWAKGALEKAMEAARNDGGISLFDRRTPILLRLANDEDEQKILRASAIGAINKEMRKNPKLCKLILRKDADEKTGLELWESFYGKLEDMDASRAIAETVREFFKKAAAKPKKPGGRRMGRGKTLS